MEQGYNMNERVINEQIKYYDSLAKTYDKLAVDNSTKGVEFKNFIQSKIESKGNCLEIASGTGIWTTILACLNNEVIALDSSPKMHKIAKQKYENLNIIKQIEFNVFDFVTSDRFDLIFSAFWISHIPKELFVQFWVKITKWLNKGGQIIFFDSYSNASENSGSDRQIGNKKFKIEKNDYDFEAIVEFMTKLNLSTKIYFPTKRTYMISAFKLGSSNSVIDDSELINRIYYNNSVIE